ncbi:MAG: hypothetical protein K6T28_00155 [Acidothermus sp.]|nr:hypothetical protein [Acidothermus sp.]
MEGILPSVSTIRHRLGSWQGALRRAVEFSSLYGSDQLVEVLKTARKPVDGQPSKRDGKQLAPNEKLAAWVERLVVPERREYAKALIASGGTAAPPAGMDPAVAARLQARYRRYSRQ